MTRALLIPAGGDGVQNDMFRAFRMYRRAPRRELGVTFKWVDATGFQGIERAIDDHSGCDIAFIGTNWREPPEDTLDFFRTLAARPDRPRLVYMDSTDATCTPHFDLLPYVDRYVKKQLLRDVMRANGDLAGGFVFPDYLHRELGWDLGGWHFGSRIDPDYADRIVQGWNIGVTRRLRNQLMRAWLAPWSMPRKSIDISCRVAIRSHDDDDWYSRHRLESVRELLKLGDRFTVIAQAGMLGSSDLVPKRQYHWEMLRSRIAFSPFGWGEICYRDFEAVASGCLLMKPAVEHLRTEPDIYVPDQTYVPVKWDLSDVQEKCHHFLTHWEDEAVPMIRAAQARYAAYFCSNRLVQQVREIIAPLG